MGFLFVPYFWFYDQSIIQSIIAFCGSLYGVYITYLIGTEETKLTYITIFISISTFILLAVYTISSIQWYLLDMVASETQMLLELIGYSTELERGENGIYVVFTETPQELRTQIIVACTGIGSIALFVGLAVSIDTLSMHKRILLAIIMSSIIYSLNAIRNLFIAGAYGGQWFHIAPEYVGMIFGRSDEWVSYYIADRIIAQFASVIVLIIFAYFIISIVDENTKIVKELIFLIDRTINLKNKIYRKFIHKDE